MLAPATPDLRAARLPLDDGRWLAFVQGRPEATVFHHPAWAGLLAACYGFRPFALALTDDGGTPVAGLPLLEATGPFGGRRWVSLPFTDCCPPLAGAATAPALVRELAVAVATGQVRRCEMRGTLPAGEGVYPAAVAVRHTLALTGDAEQLARGFSAMHRRNVRRAGRAGVRVEVGRGRPEIEAFYRLHVRTRRRLGVPVQPHRFFELLRERLLERDLGFVLTARVEGTPVAAAVFLCWNGTLVYKYGASDERAWEHRPNNLVFWEAIRWACAHGCHTLDWGRTDLADEGLRAFKRGWGAEETPLIYSHVGSVAPHPGPGRARAALGALIRRSPAWVCRALGETLYRYAG